MLTYNGLTDSLINAVKEVMDGDKKVHQYRAFGLTTEKKMDPVGNHDADIDNDGDTDKSDKYLHNRRKAISKAMGNKSNSKVVLNPVMKEATELDEEDMKGRSTQSLKQAMQKYPPSDERAIEAKAELKRRQSIGESLDELSSDLLLRARQAAQQKANTAGDKNHYVAQTIRTNQANKFQAGIDKSIKREKKRKELDSLSPAQRRKHGLGETIDEMSSKEKMKRGLYNGMSKEGIESGLENPHNCATHVYSESWGDGRTITTMHANPDEDGNIAWYDVMFEHGIEKGVPIEELEVVFSESHMHSKRGKK